MRRCKSRLAGACPVPVPPLGVIITCEDHFPGGICKVQCKDSFHDVVEEVGCYYGYTQHETSVFPRLCCRSKLTALNVCGKGLFPARRLIRLLLKSFARRKVYSHTIDCSTNQASLGPLVFSSEKNVYVPVALRPFTCNFVILIKTISKTMWSGVKTISENW